MSRYGWKRRIRSAHVRERLAQRYGIEASELDVADLEAAVNTLAPADFWPANREAYSEECVFLWRDVLVRAVVSRPSHRGPGRQPSLRRLLTVLP